MDWFLLIISIIILFITIRLEAVSVIMFAVTENMLTQKLKNSNNNNNKKRKKEKEGLPWILHLGSIGYG